MTINDRGSLCRLRWLVGASFLGLAAPVVAQPVPQGGRLVRPALARDRRRLIRRTSSSLRESARKIFEKSRSRSM